MFAQIGRYDSSPEEPGKDQELSANLGSLLAVCMMIKLKSNCRED
jgi:hypothetical protein